MSATAWFLNQIVYVCSSFVPRIFPFSCSVNSGIHRKDDFMRIRWSDEVRKRYSVLWMDSANDFNGIWDYFFGLPLITKRFNWGYCWMKMFWNVQNAQSEYSWTRIWEIYSIFFQQKSIKHFNRWVKSVNWIGTCSLVINKLGARCSFFLHRHSLSSDYNIF